MSGSGYQVDLEYLEKTVSNLKAVAAQLDKPFGCAQYNISLEHSDIGHNFTEATALYQAHAQMKAEIADMIGHLQAMIEDFSQRTKYVHSQYSGTEQSVRTDMTG